MILQDLSMLSRSLLQQHKSRGKTLMLCALLLLGLLVSSLDVNANPREQREGRGQSEQRQQSAGARISAAQAAATVEQRYGGKIISVQTRQANGRVIYSVKILQSSGHMRTVQVDGQTGAILN
jgi:uncharacterized membrane protein YkoI